MQTPAANLSGPPTHEDIHLQIADAVEKVQTEIGIHAKNRLANAFASVAARDAAITSPVAGNTAITTRSGNTYFEWYDGTAWRSVGFDVGDPNRFFVLNEDGESVPLSSTKAESGRTGQGAVFGFTYTEAWPAGVTSVSVVAQAYRGSLSSGTPIVVSALSADTNYVYVTVLEADGTAIGASDQWYCNFIATAIY
tara:strand:- start:761 stop:1345 length:585 start_codon:yes stop_codon:yes gene_type:complete